MTHNTNLRAYTLIILLIIIWGISWPICKEGLAFMPPIWFAVGRIIIGMICMFGVVAFTGKLIIPNRRDLPITFVMGFLQMAMFMGLITLGLDHVTAGRSAMLVYTTPMWVMPLAIIFFNEKLTLYKAIGFMLGMCGIFLLFSPWGVDWSDKNALIGNALLLSAAFCWSIAILCARNMKWYRSPLELLPWQLLVGLMPMLLMAYILQPSPIIQWNSTLIFSLLVTGVFATAFGYWGTLVVSKELPSITVSLCFLAVPVTTLIASALILHERITVLVAVAMLFIISGIACVALGSRQRREIPPT